MCDINSICKNFQTFKRILADVGIIGIWKPNHDSAGYHAALFQHEIESNHPLKIKEDDFLLIHPMFIRYLAASTKEIKKHVSMPTMPMKAFVRNIVQSEVDSTS